MSRHESGRGDILSVSVLTLAAMDALLGKGQAMPDGGTPRQEGLNKGDLRVWIQEIGIFIGVIPDYGLGRGA